VREEEEYVVFHGDANEIFFALVFIEALADVCGGCEYEYNYGTYICSE
jgi:hypothetical protein